MTALEPTHGRCSPDLVAAATPVVRRGKVVARWRLEVGTTGSFGTGTTPAALAQAQLLGVLADIGYEIVNVTLPDEYVTLNGGAFNVSSSERAESVYTFMSHYVRLFGDRFNHWLQADRDDARRAVVGEEKVLSVIAAQAVTDFHLQRPPDPIVGLARASDPFASRVRHTCTEVEAEIQATMLA